MPVFSKNFKPAEVFHPGEFLQQELDAREWSRAYMADKLGLPAYELGEYLEGRKRFTPEFIEKLGPELGTTVTLWNNLQAYYDYWKPQLPET